MDGNFLLAPFPFSQTRENNLYSPKHNLSPKPMFQVPINYEGKKNSETGTYSRK